MADRDRTFLVGETVHLWVRVSRPGTTTPANPTQGVVLRGLSRAGVAAALPDPVAFVSRGDGLYELVIETTSRAAGVYSWLAAASNGPQAVALVEDTFVLREPETVIA